MKNLIYIVFLFSPIFSFGQIFGGDTEVQNFKIGSHQVHRIYQGSDLVWGNLDTLIIKTTSNSNYWDVNSFEYSRSGNVPKLTWDIYGGVVRGTSLTHFEGVNFPILDFSGSTGMKIIKVSGSRLKTVWKMIIPSADIEYIDVSDLDDLSFLDLGNNNLSDIYISNNNSLSLIYLNDNNLTHLNLPEIFSIRGVYVEGNPFSPGATDNILIQLSLSVSPTLQGEHLIIRNNRTSNSNDAYNTLINYGWTIQEFAN